MTGFHKNAMRGLVLSAAAMFGFWTTGAHAEVTAFKLAVAETASQDDDLATFYRETNYQPIWTSGDEDDRARRAAFVNYTELAELHGLPAGRYDRDTIVELLGQARSERDRGRVEVELSRLFLRFAADLETGVLTPGRIDSGLVRSVPKRDRLKLLTQMAETDEPSSLLRSLKPKSAEYTRLAGARVALLETIEAGGWGDRVPSGRYEPGSSGRNVVALRDRLTAMGYLSRSATMRYDETMRRAVAQFQRDHGLKDDGVAGPSTIEALNVSPERRVAQILVAMERERWLPRELGDRHVWVNLTDFKARIIDHGEISFETRSVIGKNTSSRRTPEFSDVMDHMVINPSWYVPRSIIVGEYLPALQRNPNALSYMDIVDSRGRPANRARGFGRYNAQTFPYSMRQPPSPNNALGLVKFMFPNKYNIYLHDTPAKSLFSRNVRAFSHGCIRLRDPFDFGYALLAAQSNTPKRDFDRILRSGRETRVDLTDPVQVHIVYRTAYSTPGGKMQYRSDVYGRDAKILSALRRAGVAVP